MRFKTVLPLAALLTFVSCSDTAAPEKQFARASGIANITDVSHPGVLGVNAAGTFVDMLPGQVLHRMTFAGTEDFAISVATFSNISVDGAAFGRTLSGLPFYWLTGAGPVEVSLAQPGEELRTVYGRTIGAGEVIMAIETFESGIEPANEQSKLYRWSSLSGFQLVATSLVLINPDYQAPHIHGITNDGSVVWSISNEDYETSIYRTPPGGGATQYEVPSGHTPGTQMVGFSQQALEIGADGLGRVVGTSHNGSRYVAALWNADGTYAGDLPNSSNNEAAGSIVGDYIIGKSHIGSRQVPVRWHWNGATWDKAVIEAPAPNVSVFRVNVNVGGVIAAAWGEPDAPGYTYGLAGSTAFRPDVGVMDDDFVFADDAGNIWTAHGYFVPGPIIKTRDIDAVAGTPFTYPLTIAHPLGDELAPISWEVRWNSGVNKESTTRTAASAGIVRSVRHTYAAPGTYTIRTVATDNVGEADTTFTTVHVFSGSVNPTGSVLAPTTAEGDTVVLDASASSDPNGLPLTFFWQFDGNAQATTGPVLRKAKVLRGTHTWSVTIKNSAGATAEAISTVDVENAAPKGRFHAPVHTIQEGAAFNLSVDQITDAVSDRPPFAETEVNFDCGYGPAGYDAATSTTCGGADNGEYTVRVFLRDALGAEREYSKTITVVSVRPEIAIDHIERDGGKVRAVFGFADFGLDGPWVATYFVNGTRVGGTQSLGAPGTGLFGPWIKAPNSGDVITLNIKNQDGDFRKASMTAP